MDWKKFFAFGFCDPAGRIVRYQWYAFTNQGNAMLYQRDEFNSLRDKNGLPPIPHTELFQHRLGFEKPVEIHGWDWSTTFGKWHACVTFQDGWRGFTFPKRYQKYDPQGLRIDPSKPIEELVGDNCGIVRMLLGEVHCMSDHMSQLRAARPKRLRSAPVAIRRGWVLLVLQTIKHNRDLYLDVMGR